MKGTEKKMEKEYAYLSRRVKNLSLKKQLLAMSKEEIQHYKLIVNLEKLLK
jgi:rubrerythrin